MDWQPIETAPFDAQVPFLVWLPIEGAPRAVSALPLNVRYGEDGNTAIGWAGPPAFSMTDSAGEYYGLEFDVAPTHWAYPEPPMKPPATE